MRFACPGFVVAYAGDEIVNRFGACHMSTYAQLAAKMLRDAATFFRNVGEQNVALEQQMNDNASVYDQVADLLEKNPTGTINISKEETTTNK